MPLSEISGSGFLLDRRFFFLVTAGYAQIPTFQAELESGYRSSRDIDNPVTGSTGSEFLQNYAFGLHGYILSPNFMSYNYGMRYNQSNRKIADMWTITRSVDLFDFNSHIFQNRPISFQLNLKRTQTDISYGKDGHRTYDNLAGTDVLIQYPSLPSIQLGYLYSSSESDQFGVTGSQTSSLRLQKSTDHTSVQASFLDEQRRDRAGAGISRLQQIQLEGIADLFNNTSTLSSDIDYANYNNYRTTRFSTRFLSTPETGKRVMVLYGFNTSQSQGANSFTNSLQGDYKQTLSPSWTAIVRTNLNRLLQITGSTQAQYVNNIVSTGAEYLSVKSTTYDTRRAIANGYFDYEKSSSTDNRATVRSTGSYQVEHRFSEIFTWSNMYTFDGHYSRLSFANEYTAGHQFENLCTFSPVRLFPIQNRLTLRDYEGNNFERGFDNRTDISFLFSHSMTLRSGLIVNETIQPIYHRVEYWTNNAEYDFTRELSCTAQSSYTLDQSSSNNQGRIETAVRYQLQQFSIQFEAEEDIFQAHRNLTFFVNASRLIGGGIAKR